jgi:TIGR03790 family protein
MNNRMCPVGRILILLFVAWLIPGAGTGSAQRPALVSATSVVVVKNLNSADSVAIADYYASKRKLPTENVCAVRMTDVEECSYKEYEAQLKIPLQQFLVQLKRPIDYIVLTKGIPIRVHEGSTGGHSVDSLVVSMDKAEMPGVPDGVESLMRPSPYFQRAERFSHTRFGIYLVTRLIGYSRADCLHLVDSALAAKRRDGPFLLHTGPGHSDEGFRSINEGMHRADEILKSRHLTSIVSTGEKFPGNYKGPDGLLLLGQQRPKIR